MSKIKTGWKLPPFTLPVALLGATVSGKPNFFTVVWFNMIDDEPPHIGVAMSKGHYTRRGIRENKTFSVNIASSHMAEVVDYCGLYSGSTVDKLHLFDIFYGELETAPMVKECPLNLECTLVDIEELNTTDLIIGKIVEIYFETQCLSDNKPDYPKMDSMLFFMPEGPYVKAGEFLGTAFEMGKNFRLKME